MEGILTALIVDPDESRRQLYTESLVGAGFAVHGVEDGDAAYVSKDFAYRFLKELEEVNQYVDSETRKVKDKP